VYVIDETVPVRRFGFAYGTLPAHVEQGEERFSVELHADGAVWYDLRAFFASAPIGPCGWRNRSRAGCSGDSSAIRKRRCNTRSARPRRKREHKTKVPDPVPWFLSGARC